MALRFDLNPPRELAHIILTALARSAQCTEFYACILDALSRGGAMTVPTIICAVHGDNLAVRTHCICPLHPKS
jgi:hypothetical protein